VIPELVSLGSFLITAEGCNMGGRVSRRAGLQIIAFFWWTMPGGTPATAFLLVKNALHDVLARRAQTNKWKRRLRRDRSVCSPWALRDSWHGARVGPEPQVRPLRFNGKKRKISLTPP